VPKKAVKIPAARKSEGVRWTLQVSADAGRKSGRAPKTAKRTAAKPRAKKMGHARDKKRSHTPTEQSASLTTGRRMAAIATGVVLVIVTLAVARDPSRRALANVNAQAATTMSSATMMAPQPQIQQQTTPASRPMPSTQVATTTTHVEKPQPVAATTRQPQAAPIAAKAPRSAGTPAVTFASVPIATSASDSVARIAAAEPSATASSANVAAEPVGQAPITISGCLEGTPDGDRFRLTDTDGAGAPKARGWRSGFLKKRPAAVELIDLLDPISLRKLVGHRVLATGVLDSKELRVRSITQAGSMCD
jgi:hypothetical protein